MGETFIGAQTQVGGVASVTRGLMAGWTLRLLGVVSVALAVTLALPATAMSPLQPPTVMHAEGPVERTIFLHAPVDGAEPGRFVMRPWDAGREAAVEATFSPLDGCPSIGWTAYVAHDAPPGEGTGPALEDWDRLAGPSPLYWMARDMRFRARVEAPTQDGAPLAVGSRLHVALETGTTDERGETSWGEDFAGDVAFAPGPEGAMDLDVPLRGEVVGPGVLRLSLRWETQAGACVPSPLGAPRILLGPSHAATLSYTGDRTVRVESVQVGPMRARVAWTSVWGASDIDWQASDVTFTRDGETFRAQRAPEYAEHRDPQPWFDGVERFHVETLDQEAGGMTAGTLGFALRVRDRAGNEAAWLDATLTPPDEAALLCDPGCQALPGPGTAVPAPPLALVLGVLGACLLARRR